MNNLYCIQVTVENETFYVYERSKNDPMRRDCYPAFIEAKVSVHPRKKPKTYKTLAGAYHCIADFRKRQKPNAPAIEFKVIPLTKYAEA